MNDQFNIEKLPMVPLLPTSLVQKEALRFSVKHDIMEGTLNPLEFYRRAKLITDVIEELKKDSEIFSCAEEERKKYGKEKPVINGSVIDTGSKTTYDYSVCNDPELERLKEQVKRREAFLKSLPKEGFKYPHPETGEQIEVFPPAEKVSEFITVKI